MIRVLDCFAGMGGFSLAGEIVNHRIGKEIFKTVGFVEWEKYCQEEILKPNFKGVPIYGDIREVSARTFPDGVDLITGGFPCQDLSIAGKKEGISGERSGLYFEIVRLFDEFSALQLRPPILLMENVANLLNGNGGDWARIVFGELAARGLNAEWKVLSAESVGAPHLRERVFIVAWHGDEIPDSGCYATRTAFGTENKERSNGLAYDGNCFRNEFGDCSPIISNSDGDHSSRRQQISNRSKWEEVSNPFGSGSQQGQPKHDSKVSNSEHKRPRFRDFRELAKESKKEKGTRNKSALCAQASCPKISDSISGRCKKYKPKFEKVQNSNISNKRERRSGTTKSELGSLVDGIPARLASGQVWDQEPGGVPRVAHGVKGRVAALKAIGNSVVPEVVTIPLMRVAEILREL